MVPLNTYIFSHKRSGDSFLEAQLLSNYMGVTDSLRHTVTNRKFTISAISPLDLFGRYLQFCHIEFDKKAIYDGKRSEKAELMFAYDY